MKNGHGKYSHLIHFLKDEPLKYSDMNRFLKSTERDENGYYGIKEEYKGGKWRERKDYQGYGNTNLVLLTGSKNPLLKKNADGKYEVTEHGWENRHHPFKRTEEDLERERQWKAERIERFERARKHAIPQRIIEFVEFENDEYKLIRKVRVNQ
jgi:hypothetical protein